MSARHYWRKEFFVYPDYIVAAAKVILFGVCPLSVICASAMMRADTRFARLAGTLGYMCALAIMLFAALVMLFHP